MVRLVGTTGEGISVVHHHRKLMCTVSYISVTFNIGTIDTMIWVEKGFSYTSWCITNSCRLPGTIGMTIDHRYDHEKLKCRAVRRLTSEWYSIRSRYTTISCCTIVAPKVECQDTSEALVSTSVSAW